MVIAPFRQRVTLGADAIEVVNMFWTRRIAYSDIAAKVRIPGRWPTWGLVPETGLAKPVRFEMGGTYSFDQPFLDWLAAIPEGGLDLLRRRDG